MTHILRFYGADPIVAWLLTFGALFVIAGLAWAIQQHMQARQQRRVDERLRRFMAATLPNDGVNYPPPKGPKGFHNDVRHRRSA